MNGYIEALRDFWLAETDLQGAVSVGGMRGVSMQAGGMQSGGMQSGGMQGGQVGGDAGVEH